MITKSETDKVNYLNILLMVLSAVIAIRFPFELFLFAYGVMGPLHYLTEISWLHDRNYYTKGKHDYLFLVGISILVTLFFLGIVQAPKGTGDLLTFTAFGGALAFAFLGKVWPRVMALMGCAVLGFLLMPSLAFRDVFGIFMPTLIHVFIFTGLFILVGALKGRSLSGILSLGVFLGLTGLFAFFHPVPAGYQAVDYARENYGFLRPDGTMQGGFMAVNFTFLRDLGFHDFGSTKAMAGGDFTTAINQFLYQHPKALALMGFIAFAYTYHYLNWFSKTSIIGWHSIPRSRGLAILFLWFASLGLYAYDYTLGLQWLFFLSFLHVLLEFPLNHLTFVQAFKEMKGLILRKA